VLSQPWYGLSFFEDLLARTFAKFGVDYRLLNLPEHHAAERNAQLQLVMATTQWRTQKIFMGGSFSGKWWPFVFGVRCL